ncbi:MAG: DNA translocase FtsK 4TM domain-containing protein [Kiritimatiellia bacterium]
MAKQAEIESMEEQLQDEPPSAFWRMAAFVFLLLSIASLLALFSYQATDIPSLCAPTLTSANWLGRGGAILAYGFLLVFGIPAYILPVLFAWLGLYPIFGKALRWRPLWAVMGLFCICALFECLNDALAGFLRSDALNIAPNAGGCIGYLLNGPGTWMPGWIGARCSAVLYGILLVVSILLLVGPRALAKGWKQWWRRRRELRAEAEENAIDCLTDLEADEKRLKKERKARPAKAEEAFLPTEEPEERVQEETADEEGEVPESGEPELSASERRKLKREEERQERERLKAEKAAEKARLKAEKAAAKAAEKEARKRRDAFIFEDDDATSPEAGAQDSGLEASAVVPPPASTAKPASSPASAPAVGLSPIKLSLSPDSSATTSFRLPEIGDVLREQPPESAFNNEKEKQERSAVITETLSQFNVQGEITNVICGPVITRYEYKPAAGVRVDRISSFHHNLQMELRARSLRIIAPIPGKDVVGFEVPNIHRRPVPFRGIAETPEWKTACQKMAIPMLLGRDIDGEPVIADLAKMPHMIVAGQTGAGKSVCLNSILCGLLLARTPEQLRLVLVDPKMVEFTPYVDLPHLVVPVIVEAPKVAVCLQWAIDEMNKRLRLFKDVGVRNIASYNSRPTFRQSSFFGDEDNSSEPPAKLPYIVIVIDEMSDLMMQSGNDVEPRVVRLAQLARAVGIHLILATQRPDVTVITGLIKANFPARVAFRVTSTTNSITILDSGGAESLIGQGDMLFLNPSASNPVRAQGCWIEDDDIASITKFYRDQGEPSYIPEIKEKLDRIKVKSFSDRPIKGIEEDEDEDGSGGGNDDGDEADLKRALDVFVRMQRASTSTLQRALRIGYGRAARIVDELEARGCIGPAKGSAPREVLRATLDDDGSGAGSGDGYESDDL